MSEYRVGYGKPPLEFRFKPGVSGNATGRPKRPASSLVESVAKALTSPIKYRERGRVKSSTCGELAMRMLVDRAASGDVAASKTLLRAYAQAERGGDGGVEKIVIKNWIALPGHSGRRDAPEVASASGAKVDDSQLPPKSEPQVD